MNANDQTSKTATVVFWSIAVVLVIGLAVWRIVPKRAEAASAKCYARIQTFRAVAKAYAGTHGGKGPTSIDDFRTITPSMSPDAWFCPSDRLGAQPSVSDWKNFDPSEASYRFSVSDNTADVHSEMIRCTIHGHVLYHDGKTAKAKS